MMLDELQGTALTLDLQALSPPLLKRIIAISSSKESIRGSFALAIPR